MEDESNNAGDEPIENSIIDSIAEIMEELPEENEQIPNPSTRECDGYIIHEGESYPKPSTMRMLEREGKLPPNLPPELLAFMHLDDKDLDILFQSDSPMSILRQLYEEGFEETTDDADTNDNATVGEEAAVADVGQLSEEGFKETTAVGGKGPEEDADLKMKNLLENEKPSELKRLRDEGLLPKQPLPKIEALLNELIEVSDKPMSTDENSNGSEDSQIEIPYQYIYDPEKLPKEQFNFGYKKDCFKLLTRFSASKDQSFKDFTEEWKKMKFFAVFRQHETLDYDDLKEMYGPDEDEEKEEEEERARYEEEEEEDWDEEERLNHEEAQRIIREEDEAEWRRNYILDSVPELFLIPKMFMLPEYPKAFRRGAFYMLYALYYRQSFKTDDTLTTGEFCISFDLTEFCLFKQICDGETKQGKHELKYMYHKLVEDGGIVFQTTFNDHNQDDIDDLRSWYYCRLLELKEGIMVSEEFDEVYKAYQSIFEDGSDIKLRESLWDLILKMKNKGDISKVRHSPIPKIGDGDDEDGDVANDGDGDNDSDEENGDSGDNDDDGDDDDSEKTVQEYLDKFPEVIPNPEPGLNYSSPSTRDMEVDPRTSPATEGSTSEQRISLSNVDEIPEEISDLDSTVIPLDGSDESSPSKSEQRIEEISESVSEGICLDGPNDSSPSTPDMEVDPPTSPFTEASTSK